MLYYILGVVVIFGIGYLVGSNNPLPSVVKKIEDKAKGIVNKN